MISLQAVKSSLFYFIKIRNCSTAVGHRSVIYYDVVTRASADHCLPFSAENY